MLLKKKTKKKLKKIPEKQKLALKLFPIATITSKVDIFSQFNAIYTSNCIHCLLKGASKIKEFPGHLGDLHKSHLLTAMKMLQAPV